LDSHSYSRRASQAQEAIVLVHGELHRLRQSGNVVRFEIDGGGMIESAVK
jgi:hypothetical protein